MEKCSCYPSKMNESTQQVKIKVPITEFVLHYLHILDHWLRSRTVVKSFSMLCVVVKPVGNIIIK